MEFGRDNFQQFMRRRSKSQAAAARAHRCAQAQVYFVVRMPRYEHLPHQDRSTSGIHVSSLRQPPPDGLNYWARFQSQSQM